MSRPPIFCLMRSLVFVVALFRCAAAETPPDSPPSPFRIPPGKVLAQLRDRGLIQVPLATVERQLLADARDGDLDQFSFAEAVLIGSGVTNRSERDEYLTQLEQLEKQARKELDGVGAEQGHGDRLLKFLHLRPMSAGYSADQTDVHTILETGSFNCVSSSALFNVLASRLGYKTRSVEIPKHVFSMFHDGTKWVDVETTNKRGFNPSRDPAVREQLRKPNGVVYIPERHADLRREVGALGLTAIIYYNHGVALGKGERYAEAVTASLMAVGLDPANKAAARNARAFLNNWALALNEDKQFESALRVVTVGLRALPEDAALLNNRRVVWQHYARAEMQSGREDEALAVLRRAASEIPDGQFTVRQADLFLNRAAPLLREGQLEKALAVVDRGIDKVDGSAKDRLRKWRAAHVQHHVIGLTRSRLQAAQYDAALSAITSHATLLDDEDLVRSLQCEVYDTWAARLAAKQEWQAAIDVYVTALQKLRGHKRLSHNAAVCFDRWARSRWPGKDWEGAIRIYERGLHQFPGQGLLTTNLRYCRQQQR